MIDYDKGDLRRMLAVLAAIDANDGATLLRIVERTGIDKRSVTHLIEKACLQAGVQIAKDGATYRVEHWGPVIKRAGAKLALVGELLGTKPPAGRDKSEKAGAATTTKAGAA